MFLIYSFFWFDRICFVSRLWFWCWSGLIQDLSTDHSSLCVYECKQQLICFWLQSGFNSPSDDEEDEDVSAPAVTSPLSLSLSLSIVSTFYFYFCVLCSCCSVRWAELSARRREAEKSADQQPPYVPRSASFSRFITLSLSFHPLILLAVLIYFSLYHLISLLLPLAVTSPHSKAFYWTFSASRTKKHWSCRINSEFFSVNLLMIFVSFSFSIKYCVSSSWNTLLWINPLLEIVPTHWRQ